MSLNDNNALMQSNMQQMNAFGAAQASYDNLRNALGSLQNANSKPSKLDKAKDFLKSRLDYHPEWIIKKS